jgi:signal transduction histidine kinase
VSDESYWDALPDGVLVADGDGRVLLVNAAARRMLGETAVPGASLAEAAALQDQDGYDWFTAVQPLRSIRTRTGVPEQSWIAPDGTEVLVTTRLTWSADRRAVERVALAIRSGRGRARLDRERSDLVATVAHELRSPLTGVKGFVHALLDKWDKLNDDQKRLMLGTVVADADRLGRLIVELLDVARIDTGRLQLHRRGCDLAVITERVVESVAQSTSRPIRVEHRAPPAIDADPDKVTQVVTNLVENAIKHGDGEVVVRIGPAFEPGYAALAVSDEGEGIPLELRRRAFTKFWSASTGGGSGLGLYIVNGLVRAHGGTVTIEDRPAGGTVVTATWPEVGAPG